MQLPHFERLIAAADAVLGQVQNGELFCHGEPYISRNSEILDELEAATEAARSSDSHTNPAVGITASYVGVCQLLARLAHHFDDEFDKECIGRALQDCAQTFPDSLELIETSGGWSLEPKFNHTQQGDAQ
ncbi:hypothetical protein EV683_10539 [Crenobacter luteus]|uniref:hypothetical protein n=1 Tax=Crenobacter luteus TaxID=1452487 RepID=UPI00104ACC63|nr:hypothetical protein [Crenobacter luteus]TCP13794.1 hypothetical protein EV683_10539 [Crenobacter luteus]